jgi:exodeoxyribonuclease V beta subunit
MTAVLTRAEPATFDVCGPLPAGVTVLEASAGTGKTFTIAALAARYVAEGHARLPELLLVTFGREATQELRERVRERLVGAERGLRDPAAARRGGPGGDDTVLALLADAPHAEVARRRRRLAAALAEFDAATIATTHQFCAQMLTALGVAGDGGGEVFVESVDDLVAEVVDDFYVRKFAAPGAGTPAFDRAEAGRLARAAVGDPQARLEPAGAEPGSTAQVRFAFATAVRGEVARRKRARGLYTYDDLVVRLAAALGDPARDAARRLRGRFRVVLVDEFQDTDPLQWAILRGVAGVGTAGVGADAPVPLVLIGDPKQAIYAFRGADVVSYLDAVGHADVHATLGRNWRSDAGLLRALDRVFAGAALGDRRIVVRAVESAHPSARLAGAPVDAPLRLRVVPRAGLECSGRGLALAAEVRARVAADVAADVAALLASPATLADGRRAGEPEGRPLRAGDVAVLVRTNDQGAALRDALAAAGVPAVVSGTTSVFTTDAAREWLTLLRALEQPRPARIRDAALTCFLGRSVAELCGTGGTDADALLDELGATVRRWAAVLHGRGVAALLEAVTTGLPGRLLAAPDGERRLTDLRHVGQALHEAAVGAHLGPAALVEWLRHRIDDAATDVGLERSRRLPSDAAAVQIVTVHRSKGLEFPVVYVPFAWDRHVPREPVSPPLLHDEAGARVLDVGGPTGPDWGAHCARHAAEEAGEDLRLLYVALTRARCQVVAWWAPATTAPQSPLHRLLFGAVGRGSSPPASCAVPTDAAALVSLRALAGGDVAVEEVRERPSAPVPRAPAAAAALAAARFDRPLDLAWRRTSYTALTAAAHDARPGGVVSEPDVRGVDDEAEPDADAPPAADTGAEAVDPALAVPSPMADLPVGAGFGTLVHAVLESADLTAPDLVAQLRGRVADELDRHPTPAVDPDALAAALQPVVRTPLGPLAGGRALADVAPRDRLAELDFELPLAGGDSPGAPVVLGDLVPLLRRHLGPADPLHTYPERLAPLARQPLRGYLTGSIDAVLRIAAPDQQGPERYLVVDYKTNWLGPIGPDGPAPLTAAHYAPAWLATAMMDAHYPLQALLYSAALHRFLRWRLRQYDPQRHLGGVLYLFLRGMCGPDGPAVAGPDGEPVACGVFSWRPPAALVAELSDLLDGRPA